MDAVSQYDIDEMMSDMMRYRDDNNRTRSTPQSQAPAARDDCYDGQDWQPPFWQSQRESTPQQMPQRMPAQPPSNQMPQQMTPSTPMPSQRMPSAPMPSPQMSPSRIKDMCDCIDSLPLAMAYVPVQKWGKTYEPDVALSRGTLFPDLDKPFLAAGV